MQEGANSSYEGRQDDCDYPFSQPASGRSDLDHRGTDERVPDPHGGTYGVGGEAEYDVYVLISQMLHDSNFNKNPNHYE